MKTVLLVEDEDVIREIVRCVLEQNGYRVLAAADGFQAQDLLHQGEVIDLLLTDASLPGMTGRELAREICETHVTTQVLFMSGAFENNGLEDTRWPFIQKPFDFPLLLQVIGALLRGVPA